MDFSLPKLERNQTSRSSDFFFFNLTPVVLSIYSMLKAGWPLIFLVTLLMRLLFVPIKVGIFGYVGASKGDYIHHLPYFVPVIKIITFDLH